MFKKHYNTIVSERTESCALTFKTDLDFHKPQKKVYYSSPVITIF